MLEAEIDREQSSESLHFKLFRKAKLSLGEALQMKTLSMSHSDVVCYARTELPSIMPNLGALTLSSCDEVL